ncbi:MAG TPA: hypothetical protein VE685_05050 [Thermoanaerobaculia bacterium]|nr:hypothetical protein [Thermoanaerobaculia bacterium]
MSNLLSVPDIIGRLESQLAQHRQREAFHAEQEAFHRERRAHHAAESERIAASLESFRATAAAVTDLVNHPDSPPRTAPSGTRAPRISLPRMVASALERLGLFEPFGISKVTAEVNRLFGDRLREPVDPRQVSVVLRRMASRRQIHVVQKGRQRQQTLYTRERPEGTAG